MGKWIIKDWTGKQCVTDHTFATFDDAWEALSGFVDESIKPEIENHAEYLFNQEIGEYRCVKVK